MLPPFSIVIPAFNEEDRIGRTLHAALDYLRDVSRESEIIVVDDGSTDRTSAVASAIFAERGDNAGSVIVRSSNQGKGAAVRAGLLAATRPIGLFFDADLSTPIEETPKLIEPIAADELDIAFGSRAVNRRLIGDRQPWRREQAGRVFNLLVRASTGLPFKDTQCGFKAFRLATCRTIIQAGRIDGFGFDVELLYLATRAGLRTREIPVRWNHREASKVHFVHDSLRMLREVVVLRAHANGGEYDSVLARPVEP
jgi:glycosyltransferase involved in cell wall biosynthesis